MAENKSKEDKSMQGDVMQGDVMLVGDEMVHTVHRRYLCSLLM